MCTKYIFIYIYKVYIKCRSHFPNGSVGKESAWTSRDPGEAGLIP